MTRDYDHSIKQQMRLLDHLEQDLSIHKSDLLADMWDNLKHSGSLKNSYIQTLESQIHLVKPKLVFLWNKYHIHYVFGSRAESELYNLYLARTVPFNTTAGSYQIDIKPTMKVQNIANMHSYIIRPHDLLSSCEQFENTFYCTSASIEKDSIDQCIQAAKTRNLPMLLKHCHVYPVNPRNEIIRLSPGMVYYDMKAKVGHTCGGMIPYELIMKHPEIFHIYQHWTLLLRAFLSKLT